MKRAKTTGEVRIICRACAERLGATWPEGYCATQWYQRCEVCGTEQVVCSSDDWNWPDGRATPDRD